MKRIAFVTACVVLAGCSEVTAGADDQPVTAERIEAALSSIGVRPIMAGCIAPRALDQLDTGELRALEQLADDSGVAPGSLSDGKAMGKLRPLENRETAKTIVSIAGGCGFDLMRQGI